MEVATLIGDTILACCSLALLGSWTSVRFSLTVGFFQTAEDNTACNTGARLSSSATCMGSFCELPQSQWRHIPQNRWTLGGT